MKFVLTCLLLLTTTFCSFKNSNTKLNLEIKTVFKSVYENGNYLIELKLINKSSIPTQFFTMSCTTGGNLVYDTLYFKPVINKCAGNFLVPITLNPYQEFSFTFLFKPIKQSEFLKIGWVLLNDENVPDVSLYKDVLAKSKIYSQNIIWAPTINLNGSGQPFEIK